MLRWFLLLESLLLITSYTYFQDVKLKAKRLQAHPLIDGKLNDEVWNRAVPFSGFLMLEPKTGIEPTEKTEILQVRRTHLPEATSSLKPPVFLESTTFLPAHWAFITGIIKKEAIKKLMG